MVKVKFAKEEYEVMKKFESHHHPDIWKWIMDKIISQTYRQFCSPVFRPCLSYAWMAAGYGDARPGPFSTSTDYAFNEEEVVIPCQGEDCSSPAFIGRDENLNILDVSEEACVFAISLAEKHSNNKLMIAARGEKPNFDLPSNVTYKLVDFRKNFDDIDDIGKFDVIILNEVTHEISDMAIFFKKLKTLLKDGAPIVILSRPKNPPLPVPDCCLLLWRKLAPTREEILAAAKAADMTQQSFSAAVPVSVDRFDWEKILYSGCFPAVRNTIKCTEKEIRDYCNNISGKVTFEEKLNIFLLKNA